MANLSFNREYINDVMSGDENGLDSERETVMSNEDLLEALLGQTATVTGSSNLRLLQTNLVHDLDQRNVSGLQQRSWHSFSQLPTNPPGISAPLSNRPSNGHTSGYGSEEITGAKNNNDRIPVQSYNYRHSTQTPTNENNSRMQTLSEEVKFWKQKSNLHKDSISQLETDLNRTKQELESTKLDRDNEIEVITAEIRKRDELIAQLRKDLNEQVAKQAAARPQRNMEMENKLKERVSELEAELKVKASNTDKLRANYQNNESSLQSELSQVLLQLNKLKADHSDAQLSWTEERNRLQQRLTQVNNEHAEMVKKINQNFQEQVSKEKEGQLRSLKLEQDINAELRNKIRGLTDEVGELEKNIQMLNLTNTETNRKMESLQSQLVEVGHSESKKFGALKLEAESQQSTADRLSQETVRLTRLLDESREAVNMRDSSINKLNDKIVNIESEKSELDRQISRITEDLQDKVRAQQDKDREIEQLKIKLSDEKLQEECRRREIKQAKQREDEIMQKQKIYEKSMKSELEVKESECEWLKKEIEKWRKICEERKESLQIEEQEKEKLQETILNWKEKHGDLEVELSKYSGDKTKLENHNRYLEEEITKLKLSLEDAETNIEKMSKEADNKKHDQLEEKKRLERETCQLQKAIDELMNRVEERDNLLKSLAAETGKLKMRYRDKCQENRELSEEIQKMRRELNNFQENVRQIQSDKDRFSREQNILRAEITEMKDECNRLQEELFRKDEEVKKLSSNEREAASKVETFVKELESMKADNEDQESELNALRARLKAAVEEASRADQSEKLLRHDYANEQEELRQARQEIESWKLRVHEYEQQIARCTDKINELEDVISERDHRLVETENSADLIRQECANKKRDLQQLETEMGLTKSNLAEQNNKYQSLMNSMKGQIAQTNLELQENQEALEDIRKKESKTKLEYHEEKLAHTKIIQELEETNRKLAELEKENDDWMEKLKREKINTEQIKIESKNQTKKIELLQKSEVEKNQKIKDLEENNERLNIEISRLTKNIQESQQKEEILKREIKDVKRVKSDSLTQSKKMESCMKEISNELENCGKDRIESEKRIFELETELKNSLYLLDQKQNQVDSSLKKVEKKKKKLEAYRNDHSTSNDDVDKLNKLLLEEAHKTNAKDKTIAELTRRLDNIITEIERKDKVLSQQNDDLEKHKKTIDFTVKEKETYVGLLEELKQKRDGEIKKMKIYSKKVEKDLIELQRKIEDQNTMVIRLEEKLFASEKKSDECKRDRDEAIVRLEMYEKKMKEKQERVPIYENNLSEDMLKMMGNITSTNAELMATQKKLETANREKQELELLNNQNRERVNEANEKVKRVQEETKRLQSMLSERHEEIEKMRAECCEQRGIVERSKDKQKMMQTEKDQKMVEIRTEKQKNSMLEVELEGMQTRYKNNIEHQQLMDSQIEEQEKLIDELQKEVISVRKSLSESCAENRRKQTTICELEEKLQSANFISQPSQSSFSKQVTTQSSSKIRELQDSLWEREAQVELLQDRLNKAHKDVEALYKKIQEQEREFQKKLCERESPSQQEDNIKILETNLKAKESELENIKQKLKEQQEAYDQASLDLSLSQQRTSRLQDENRRLLEYQRLNAGKQNNNLPNITKRLHELENENLELRDKARNMREKEVQQQQTNRKVDEITKMLKKESQDKAKFQTEIARLEQENETLLLNFNRWIEEQKAANEKLGRKIQEKNTLIGQLQSKPVNMLHQGRKDDEDSDDFVVTSLSEFQSPNITRIPYSQNGMDNFGIDSNRSSSTLATQRSTVTLTTSNSLTDTAI